MWTLEHDGDLFAGKRKWLRPGCSHIMGRTPPSVDGITISARTVSRRHLKVEVSLVTAEDARNHGSRSIVTLTDMGTKLGTLVDGQQIREQPKILGRGNSFEIKLGVITELFRIKWIPCSLCFSFTGKELKANPLAALAESLGPLDIKVDIVYRPETTHVIAAKRNTSRGLQALVNGRYIVQQSFVDTVVAACQSIENEKSQLENDFDANWPDATAFLPPRGAEVTSMPDDAYRPNENRKTVFEGYTFICYNKTQFETLLAPITAGRGKALYREVDPQTTDFQDFVRYVKSVAGEKGLGSFEDGSEGKGVVVIRFAPQKGSVVWFEKFWKDVMLQLDHRMVDQGEFLDAILNNDASVLRRPLEVESTAPQPTAIQPTAVPTAAPVIQLHSSVLPSSMASGIMAPPATALGISSQAIRSQAVSEAPAEPSQNTVPSSSAPASRLGRSRRIIKNRFKGFDDFEDLQDEPDSQESVALPQSTYQSQYNSTNHNSLFVSQAPDSIMPESIPARQKRARSPIVEDTPEELMNMLAPNAANLKRRKLAETAARRQRGELSPSPEVRPTAPKPTKIAPRHKREEIDILEQARLQKERTEQQEREERESLVRVMDGMDIASMSNLAIIEDMPVGRSIPRPTRAIAEEGTRWDEKWTGRKNFKRFKRRGDDPLVRRGPRVIVQLEEVRKKDFGIGDGYWLGDDTAAPRTGESQARSQGRSQRVSHVGSQIDSTGAVRRRAQRGSRMAPTTAEDSPFAAARASRSSTMGATQNASQSTGQDLSAAVERSDHANAWDERALERGEVGTETAQQSGDKRGATEPLQRVEAAKRARPTMRVAPATRGTPAARAVARGAVVQVVSDEEDDGVGFKFGRRRRR